MLVTTHPLCMDVATHRIPSLSAKYSIMTMNIKIDPQERVRLYTIYHLRNLLVLQPR